MYLSKRKNGKHYYLSLVESVRVNGQVYKKTVKQFGRIDLLDPQFVTSLEEQYAKQKLSRQLTAQQQRDEAVKAVQKLQHSAVLDSHFNKAPLLRYGHLPLKALPHRQRRQNILYNTLCFEHMLHFQPLLY